MAGPTAEGCSGLPKARTRRVFFDRSDQPGTPFRVRSPFHPGSLFVLFALFVVENASGCFLAPASTSLCDLIHPR